MKKITYFSLFVAVLFTVFACSSSPKSQPQSEPESEEIIVQVQSPGDVAKEYLEYAIAGDYETLVASVAVIGDATAEDFEKQKEVILTFLKEGTVNSVVEEKGGVKTIEIVSETLSENESEAQVVLKQTFGNDETQEQIYDLVKQDDTWKWIFNPAF